MAIVAATSAICSAVACTLPWPIAEAPSSRFDRWTLAGGIVLAGSPASGDGALNPKRCAMVKSRLAPSRTPSGANTELQETAKELMSVPPHASPLAFCKAKPSIVASVAIVKVSFS